MHRLTIKGKEVHLWRSRAGRVWVSCDGVIYVATLAAAMFFVRAMRG